MFPFSVCISSWTGRQPLLAFKETGRESGRPSQLDVIPTLTFHHTLKLIYLSKVLSRKQDQYKRYGRQTESRELDEKVVN